VPAWRLPADARAVFVDDKRAVASIAAGWIAEVDLATGAVRSRRTPIADRSGELSMHRAGDGRIVTAIVTGDRMRLYAIEPDLGVTLVRQDRARRWVGFNFAIAGDGRVVGAGTHEPLATWASDLSRSELALATERGFQGITFAAGDRKLLASRGGTLYVVELIDRAPAILRAIGDGWWLATGGSRALAAIDDNVVVVDLEKLAIDKTIESIAGLPPAAALSPDGTHVALASAGTVRVRELASGITASLDLGPTPSVQTLRFTPDGRRVVAFAGATVRVVDVAGRSITAPGDGPHGKPSFVAVTRDAVIAGHDRTRRWPIGGGAAKQLGPDKPAFDDGAVSPSGKLVAVSHGNGDVSAWRIDSGAVLGEWKRSDRISTLALDDNRRRAAT
jgi:hypothetical protein